MSTERKNGGPAFPTLIHPYGDAPGMTLRDWFAGQALSAIVGSSFKESWDAAASDAYAFADAMLVARKDSK